MREAARRYGIALADPQLAAAPFRSTEGQDYFGAMQAAANYAWAALPTCSPVRRKR